MDLAEAIVALVADIPDDGMDRMILISRNPDGSSGVRLTPSVDDIIARLIKNEDIDPGTQRILIIRKEAEGRINLALSNDIIEVFTKMIFLAVEMSKRGDDLDPEMVRQSIKQLYSEITFVSERVKKLEE